MHKLLASTITATALATSALASGPIAPPPPPQVVALPTAFDWSGGHVGLFVGTTMGDNFWSERSIGVSSLPGAWSGTPWGLTAGYDRQRGNLVFGGALDLTGGTIDATSTTLPGFSCATGCVTEVSRSAALRGRVGWAQDRTLVYATAGLAIGEATATDAGVQRGNGNLSGWVAGFGMEHAVSDRFSLFAEYLYTDLGRLEIATLCNFNCFTDVTYGTLRIGANLRW